MEDKIVARKKIDEARQLAVELAGTLEDKLAEKVVVLDMRKLMCLTDYFILATGRNARHTRSLTEELSRVLKTRRQRPVSVEGLPEGNWVLFDVGDVVVHLFEESTREFYDLESLWGDAIRSRWRQVWKSLTPSES